MNLFPRYKPASASSLHPPALNVFPLLVAAMISAAGFGWLGMRASPLRPVINHEEQRFRAPVEVEGIMLRDILNLGIATLAPAEVQEVVNRYVYVKIVEGFDRRVLFMTLSLASLVVAVTVFWIQRLQKLSRKLYESERSKSILLSNLPGMAYRCKVDEHWTMMFISDGCEQLTGYPSRALLGNAEVSFNELIDPSMRELVHSRWEDAITFRTPVKLEYKLLTAGGEEKWVYEQGVAVFDSQDHLSHLEGLIVDITDRKRLEEELREATQAAGEANRAHSRFLAMVTHEIRTPINGIIGIGQLLNESELELSQRRHLEMILSSGRKLLTLVNNFLDHSKLEAGKLQLRLEPFSAGDLIKSVKQSLDVLTKDKSVKLKAEVAPDVPPLVRGDAGRVEQILNNLVSNAIKFTEQGTVTVRLNTSAESDSDRVRLCFEVEDSGCGISEEDKTRLFQDYVQVDESSRRAQSGTGLGLAISKQLAEAMNGEISVQSEPGNGSCFRVEIPFEPVEPVPGKPAASSQRKLENVYRGQNCTALVVDDNQVNREVAMAILGKLGLQVVMAESGKEALEIVEQNPPDIVFMDIAMPDMDGFEVCAKLRERNQLNRRGEPMPVVAISAHTNKTTCQDWKSKGLNGWLAKPYTPKEIVSLMTELGFERKA